MSVLMAVCSLMLLLSLLRLLTLLDFTFMVYYASLSLSVCLSAVCTSPSCFPVISKPLYLLLSLSDCIFYFCHLACVVAYVCVLLSVLCLVSLLLIFFVCVCYTFFFLLCSFSLLSLPVQILFISCCLSFLLPFPSLVVSISSPFPLVSFLPPFPPLSPFFSPSLNHLHSLNILHSIQEIDQLNTS